MQRQTTHVSLETTERGRAQREHKRISTNAMLGLAPVGTPTPFPDGVWALDALKHEARESVRVVRDYAEGLTTKDHYFLRDLADGKYLTGMLKFNVLALKCREVAPATVFAERLRGFQVRHHPKAHVDLMDAFGAESHSNGEFDAAQIAYSRNPSEQNRQRAIEAGNKQLVETHRSLMALHRERGR